MRISFSKYQGTGNDFILIDKRENKLMFSVSQIKMLCDRKFGIGADGLILLENDPSSNFKMSYFNSDGNESSMCGNGGRCIVAFARKLGLIDLTARFTAVDGLHEANCMGNEIALGMKNVCEIENCGNSFFLDTGSPHVVCFVSDVKAVSIIDEARKIRYNERFVTSGTNVNFAQIKNEEIYVRTYERGVEDETLSCGTGVTAAALAAHHLGYIKKSEMNIITPGGKLNVKFKNTKAGCYDKIYLSGPATFVFEGFFELN